MTELEKIAYAKTFIDKLADGINPLDDSPIPEGDITNNVRLTRCFFYVSDILGRIIENEGINREYRIKEEKIPFEITTEQLVKYNFSPFSVTVSEISKQLTALCDNPKMKTLSAVQINSWLLFNGYLTEGVDPHTNKRRKLPTQKGIELGISTLEKQDSFNRPYITVVYNSNAQRFILSNLDEIKVFSKK